MHKGEFGPGIPPRCPQCVLPLPEGELAGFCLARRFKKLAADIRHPGLACVHNPVKALWFLVMVFILSGTVYQSANADALSVDVLSPALTQADFALLRQSLEEGHPGLYRYSNKDQIDAMFDREQAKLNQPLSRLAFRAVVAETLAAIKCGHTSLNGDIEMDAAMNSARQLPLRVLIEGQSAQVLFNDTPDDDVIQPGMAIVSVNGRPIGDLLERFRAVTSGDGDIESGKDHDLTERFARYYWWLIEQPAQFTIIAKDDAGKTVVAKLAGVTEAERKSNHNSANNGLMQGAAMFMAALGAERNFTFIEDPQIAEIRLHHFLGDDYRQWMTNTFATLNAKGTRALVIDLRGNGGGIDEYGAMLVSELTDKPFRYFDRIRINTYQPSFAAHLDDQLDAAAIMRFKQGTIADPAGGFLLLPEMNEGLKLQPPAAHPFLGPVFILTDGGSFSTTADVCAILHHLHRATFIGEEAGGGYFGNDSGRMATMTLPNSNVKFRFPFYEYWNAVGGDNQFRRHGTIPDYPVELRINDLIHGVDAQHALAVKLAEANVAGR